MLCMHVLWGWQELEPMFLPESYSPVVLCTLNTGPSHFHQLAASSAGLTHTMTCIRHATKILPSAWDFFPTGIKESGPICVNRNRIWSFFRPKALGTGMTALQEPLCPAALWAGPATPPASALAEGTAAEDSPTQVSFLSLQLPLAWPLLAACTQGAEPRPGPLCSCSPWQRGCALHGPSGSSCWWLQDWTHSSKMN